MCTVTGLRGGLYTSSALITASVKISLSPLRTPWTAVVPTQANIQWVTEDLSPGILKICTHHNVVPKSSMTGGKTTPSLTQWRTGEGGGLGRLKPPEIPKALQNHAKLNPIVKTAKNS